MSEIEYEVQMMMDHVDEEKAAEETASMIEVLNSATEDFRRNEESARIAASMDEFFSPPSGIRRNSRPWPRSTAAGSGGLSGGAAGSC